MSLDIVEIFQNYCDSNDIKFSFGSKNILNLTRSNSFLEPNKIYLFMEEFKSDTIKTYLKTEKIRYKGLYFLLYTDDRSTNVYNENNSNFQDGKYVNKIRPLIPNFKGIDSQFSVCDGLDVNMHGWQPAINVFSENYTGIMCEYDINIYEY